MWHRQVALLSKHPRFSLLLIDNRGTGASSIPKEGYDLATMARDAWGVVDSVFGRDCAVHVVGHSMGSMIAQRVAILVGRKGEGGRVKSLSLLGSNQGGWFWSNVPSGGLVGAFLKMIKTGFEDVVQANVYMRLHYTERFLNGVEGGVARKTRYLKRYLDGIRRERKVTGREDLFWRHLGAARGHELSDEDVKVLKMSCYPKLVVYGREDVVVVPRASVELADKIGAQAVGLNAAHFMAEECAAEVTELLMLQFERARCGMEAVVDGATLGAGDEEKGSRKQKGVLWG